MVWGGISHGVKSPLIVVPKTTNQKPGRPTILDYNRATNQLTASFQEQFLLVNYQRQTSFSMMPLQAQFSREGSFVDLFLEDECSHGCIVLGNILSISVQ